MITIKVIEAPKFGAFAINLTQELNDAAKIVKLDIQTKMKAGKDYKGFPLPPLKQSTIESKLRSKNKKTVSNASRPMLATENLVRNQNINRATKSNQTVEIYIGPTRDEIYGYHHNGEGNLPVRQTFGLAEDLGPKIDKMIINSIEQALAKL